MEIKRYQFIIGKPRQIGKCYLNLYQYQKKLLDLVEKQTIEEKRKLRKNKLERILNE